MWKDDGSLEVQAARMWVPVDLLGPDSAASSSEEAETKPTTFSLSCGDDPESCKADKVAKRPASLHRCTSADSSRCSSSPSRTPSRRASAAGRTPTSWRYSRGTTRTTHRCAPPLDAKRPRALFINLARNIGNFRAKCVCTAHFLVVSKGFRKLTADQG